MALLPPAVGGRLLAVRAMTQLSDALFTLSPLVRYVALLRGQELQLRERPGLSDASASETDRYEELLVNPKAARATGIVLPADLVARAARVVE